MVKAPAAWFVHQPGRAKCSFSVCYLHPSANPHQQLRDKGNVPFVITAEHSPDKHIALPQTLFKHLASCILCVCVKIDFSSG